jgi:hypothetical protein
MIGNDWSYGQSPSVTPVFRLPYRTIKAIVLPYLITNTYNISPYSRLASSELPL